MTTSTAKAASSSVTATTSASTSAFRLAGARRVTAVGALAVAALLPQTAGTAAASTSSASSASSAPTVRAAAAPVRLGQCGAGELCLWEKDDFKGARKTYELAGIDIESCVPLPKGTSVQSLANRTGRPVTTYQSEECGETAEFETYPGGGTWLPRSPYRVRAFKVWER
ncbi:peptidase inhibitor family I36 protein [Streptomyces sp. NPDC004749]